MWINAILPFCTQLSLICIVLQTRPSASNTWTDHINTQCTVSTIHAIARSKEAGGEKWQHLPGSMFVLYPYPTHSSAYWASWEKRALTLFTNWHPRSLPTLRSTMTNGYGFTFTPVPQGHRCSNLRRFYVCVRAQVNGYCVRMICLSFFFGRWIFMNWCVR